MNKTKSSEQNLITKSNSSNNLKETKVSYNIEIVEDTPENVNESFGNIIKNEIKNLPESISTCLPITMEIENKITNIQSSITQHEENVDNRLEFTLKTLDLENLIPIFKSNILTFNDLLFLSKEDLLEMNVQLGPRNRILKIFRRV